MIVKIEEKEKLTWLNSKFTSKGSLKQENRATSKNIDLKVLVQELALMGMWEMLGSEGCGKRIREIVTNHFNQGLWHWTHVSF